MNIHTPKVLENQPVLDEFQSRKGDTCIAYHGGTLAIDDTEVTLEVFTNPCIYSVYLSETDSMGQMRNLIRPDVLEAVKTKLVEEFGVAPAELLSMAWAEPRLQYPEVICIEVS